MNDIVYNLKMSINVFACAHVSLVCVQLILKHQHVCLQIPRNVEK